ncbi:MAG: phasin-related domain-containing protein [bacterium]
MTDFKETTQKAEELARNIWLAGLGAYGKNLEAVQGSLQGNYEKSQAFFDKLVSRGEKLEADAKVRLDETQSKIKEASDSLQKRRQEILDKSKSALEDGIKLESIKDRLTELRGKVEKSVELPELNLESYKSQISQKVEEATSKLKSLVKA